MTYLIDSHCHLHDKEFFTENEAEQCLKRAKENGVKKIICIGTSHEDSLAAQEFASKHPDVYWTYGIHPEAASEISTLEAQLRQMQSLAWHSSAGINESQSDLVQHPPVGIGEIGLDYHYAGYDREAQIRLFEEMLQLAVDNDLPVSFHVREAFDDFFPVIENFPLVRGVVHSFTDSKKVLGRLLAKTEFYVGVNGLATYSTLPLPPLERILLETDAPFLAPVPYRGDKNEPAHIAAIVNWLASRVSTSIDEVSHITTDNATQLFQLDT